jgi:hypothetical protein
MPSVDLNSTRFRCYSRALLENDADVVRTYVKDALAVIDESQSRPGLKDNERESMQAAPRDLHLIERQKLQKAA